MTVSGRPHNVSHFIGENCETARNQSMQAVLNSLQNPISSNLISCFYELIQSKIDPPLEAIWIFSALRFRNSNSSKMEALNKLSAIKDLFQSIVSSSASCNNSIKCIALISPVIYNLHGFIFDFTGSELRSKKERKVQKEVKGLIGAVLGYINVCCEGLNGSWDDFNDLIQLGDLVSIWIGSNVAEDGSSRESLKVFFPLLGDEILENVSIQGFEMKELAGFVIAQVFLLKVCLKTQESSGKESLDELGTWVVASVTAFQSSYLYVTLVRMLLEPMLPVSSLLNPSNELLLRKILYDAFVLVEYSFLAPGSLAQLSARHMKNITLGKLMVTHKAIEYYRKNADQNKATSYFNAFATSSLPSELLKWIKRETGSEVASSGPDGSSPKAFLRWMLNIENRGIRIFDDMSKFRAKLISDGLKEGSDQFSNKGAGKALDTDLFYIDNKGETDGNEDEMMSKSMHTAFLAAAHSMQSAEHGGTKRQAKNSKNRKKLKFLKYTLSENSESLAFPSNDGRSSGSEVENPSSDEDMDEGEQ